MNIEKLKKELRRDEGVRYSPYKDSVGVWTVGCGWNLEARGLPNTVELLVEGGRRRFPLLEPMSPLDATRLAERGFTLTVDSIDFLLDLSIRDATTDARELVHDFENLSDDRQRAFVNIAFNLGQSRMAGFRKMRAAAKRYDWAECSRQMLDSKWARQVGARADRLAAMVLSDG
jgi:lysozyme